MYTEPEFGENWPIPLTFSPTVEEMTQRYKDHKSVFPVSGDDSNVVLYAAKRAEAMASHPTNG